MESIKNNTRESRKEWMVCMFERAGKKIAVTQVFSR
jgi:hypothetical protein